MKLIILNLLLIFSVSSFSEGCIKFDGSNYKVELPTTAKNITIDGDTVAYCVKFNLPDKGFDSWMKKCNLTADPLHHAGQILELEFDKGIVTIVDTGKNNQAYIEVINSKDYAVFKEHIGVARQCTL